MSGRSGTIEAAWTHLKLSNPSSPANLLCCVAQASAGQAKAVRQVESLAQILLSLCPSLSRSVDITSEAERQLPPDVALSIQHLAFKLRQKWWTLAKHAGNQDKDILDPFAKCMVAFARRSKLSPASKYKMAELLFKDLSERSGHKKPDEPHHDKLAAQCLSSLAQQAGLEEMALKWCGSPGHATEAKESPAAKTACLLRIAALSFESALKKGSSDDFISAVSHALEALSGSLAGSSLDLDALFSQVKALRRRATQSLWSVISDGSGETASSFLLDQALRIITACIHFLARCTGSATSEDVDPKSQALSYERTRVALDLTSIIDSASIGAKYLLRLEQELRWTDLDTLITDCVTIVRHCEQSSESSRSANEELADERKPFVRLANLYWTASMRARKLNDAVEPSKTAMERAVALLGDRPAGERQVGSLAMRYEFLGDTLARLNDIAKARLAFFNCLKNFTDNGILHDAVQLAAQEAEQEKLQQHKPTSSLSRVLTQFQRTYVNGSIAPYDGFALFDDPQIDTTSRGLLFEMQLSSFSNLLSQSRSWDASLTVTVQKIAKVLFELYTVVDYPIRRRRVVLLLLQLSQTYPEIFPRAHLDEEVHLAATAADVSSSRDCGLSRFQCHITTMVRLKHQLQMPTPNMDIVSACINTWQSLIDGNLSGQELCQCVDNVDLLIQHLNLVSDLLAVKGEEYLRLQALLLLTQLISLKQRTNTSALVISTTMLALQYLRLGYSGKAGLTFAKVESLLQREDASTESKLQWHLGYAEYLLGLGNKQKW
jgi:separase